MQEMQCCYMWPLQNMRLHVSAGPFLHVTLGKIVCVVKAPAGLCSLAHNEPCRWRKRQLTFQTEFDLCMDHLSMLKALYKAL